MATAVALSEPVLPFGAPQAERKPVPVTATEHSLLEIDREMDVLFDHIQDELEETGEPSQESKERFQQFCDVFGDKVDRIGRFIRVMEARAAYCKGESARLTSKRPRFSTGARQPTSSPRNSCASSSAGMRAS